MGSWFTSGEKKLRRLVRDAFFGIFSVTEEETVVPLRDIKFHADIKDCLSTVEITQLYVNSNTFAVECEYLFPIDPHTTAITGLTITLDDKVVEAKVMEREKAEEKYVDAIAQDNTAFKVNQDKMQPDIVRIAIGNLQPGKEVTIVTRYVKLLETENGCWSFRIPLAYTPRYSSRYAASESDASVEFVKGSELPYKWHLNMEISASRAITKVVSPSRKIDSKFKESNKKAAITLANQNTAPDSDLIILYRTEDFGKPSIVLQKSAEYDEYAAMISFCPMLGEEADPYRTKDIDGSGEYIFLLDCSGSMSGEKIELAKTALEMFLRSLPVDSTFNIVCFGSDSKSFKRKAVKCTPESLKEVLKLIYKIDAEMGGTNIYGALEKVFSKSVDHFYPRSIFLLTDGEVSEPEKVIDLIRKNAHNTRVHTFGVGNGASRELVKGSAIAGNGSFQFAVEGEDLTPKVMKSLRDACLAAYTEAEVVWPSKAKVELQSTSSTQMPNVYINEPFIMLALVKGRVKGEKIRLHFKETANHKEISLEAALPDKAIKGKDIYQAVVKTAFERNKKLQDKDKIRLSIKYSVLSQLTAFVGVQKNKGKAGASMKTVEIPIVIARNHGTMSMYDSDSSFDELMNSSGVKECKKAKKYFSYKKARKTYTCSPIESVVDFSIKEEELQDAREEVKEDREYMRIIRTQEMFGSWIWNKATLAALGVSEAKAQSKIPAKLKEIVSNEKDLLTAWVTILAMAKLEKTCADSKSSWQLLFKKAVQWLRKSKVDYAEFKALAIDVI